MNNKNWLISIEFNFIFILFLSLVQIIVCIDVHFQACVPKSCGANDLNISYPFWIHGTQNSTCGFPGFELYCNNTEPILRISGEDYVVKNISYGDQSLLVTKIETLQREVCSHSTDKMNLYRSPFSFLPGSVNISIFFNCSASTSDMYSHYSLGCSSGNATLALFSDNPLSDYLNQSSGCERFAFAPVEMIANGSLGTSIVDLGNLGFNLRWNASRCDECEASGGRCGFDFDMYKFMCFCPDRPHQRSCKNRKKLKIGIKAGIGIGTGFGGIIVTCIVFILYQRRKRIFSSSTNLISRDISDGSFKPNFEQGSIYFQTPIFTYKELDEATDHFDSSKELGDGGFGTVYHGKLRDGRVVAVKRLFEHNYNRVEQFMNEIVILSRLRHQNLVSLYGCTSQHSRELLLVYEYVPNGTVADHLHGDRADSGLLTWPIRMSIAIESADAVSYLHASDIIHRDIKTNNILLDSSFHVKVADFGLSRLFPTECTHISTAPQGTPGYVDPEYYQCYQLNDKSDVYSFGVVLIELISSQPAVDIGRHRKEINLANLAINRIHKQALHELVDPSLGFDSDYDTRVMITLVAELAFRCLQQDREIRPSMVEVLEILKGIESEGYKKKMKKTDETDTSAEMRLLNLPFSPDSVTDAWISKSSTPNSSA